MHNQRHQQGIIDWNRGKKTRRLKATRGSVNGPKLFINREFYVETCRQAAYTKLADELKYLEEGRRECSGAQIKPSFVVFDKHHIAEEGKSEP